MQHQNVVNINSVVCSKNFLYMNISYAFFTQSCVCTF